MKQNMIKVPSKVNSALNLDVMPGHFATSHSHINYYVDMTSIKSRLSEATAAAKIIAQQYSSSTRVRSNRSIHGGAIDITWNYVY